MKIDNIGKKILYLLQKDARMTYKDIAKELKRSETATRDRIKAMESAGIIQGYTALIDKTALGFHCFAMILANAPSSNLDSITKRIKNAKNVLRVYQISGEHKLAIFMVAPSFRELKEFLRKDLSPLGLSDEEIILVLDADREFLSPLEIP